MAISFNNISIDSGVALTITPPPSSVYLWSWGRNYAGALGLGDTTNRSSPVQIGALTTWLTIAAGNYYNLAIKTDGTLWTWGLNQQGKLGLSNSTSYNSPVQIGALTNWSKVAAGASHSMAIGAV